MAQITLTVNGAPFEYDGSACLNALLEALNVPRGRAAVMLNGEVVPAVAREAQALADGDQIEIIVLAGGG